MVRGGWRAGSTFPLRYRPRGKPRSEGSWRCQVARMDLHISCNCGKTPCKTLHRNGRCRWEHGPGKADGQTHCEEEEQEQRDWLQHSADSLPR